MAYTSRKDIKVPESYIQKIRDTKTKSAALAKYGKSTDPKMREALRRFYGDANVVSTSSKSAPKKDTTSASSRNRPRNSVPMRSSVSETKPKSGSTMIAGRKEAMAKMTPSQRKRNDDLAKFGKNVLYPVATSVLPVTKGAMAAKAVYGAAAKRAGVGTIKSGVKKGIATKSELSAARSTARGIVKDDIKLKSKTAKLKASNAVKRNTKNATSLQRANSIRRASKAGQ
jgi:hypothetical protein